MQGWRVFVCALAGAPLDTGNRGVEALSRSVLAAVARWAPGSLLTVLDNGWGVRPGSTGNGISVELAGVRRSRRVYRRESWANVRLSQHLRGAGNPVARSLRQCDAVLDISGGDSFTDIYGPGRLRTVLSPKLAALRAGRPLLLLPQTYGPFTDPDSRRAAARVVRQAEIALARDDESYAVLAELAGPDFDPSRHRLGVDVAFDLAPRRPSRATHEAIVSSLERQRARPLVGVNVERTPVARRCCAEVPGLEARLRRSLPGTGPGPGRRRRGRPARAPCPRRGARARERPVGGAGVARVPGELRGDARQHPSRRPGCRRGQVGHRAARLVQRRSHARDDRSPLQRRSSLRHRLQHEDPRRLRHLWSGRRGGGRSLGRHGRGGAEAAHGLRPTSRTCRQSCQRTVPPVVERAGQQLEQALGDVAAIDSAPACECHDEVCGTSTTWRSSGCAPAAASAPTSRPDAGRDGRRPRAGTPAAPARCACSHAGVQTALAACPGPRSRTSLLLPAGRRRELLPAGARCSSCGRATPPTRRSATRGSSGGAASALRSRCSSDGAYGVLHTAARDGRAAAERDRAQPHPRRAARPHRVAVLPRQPGRRPGPVEEAPAPCVFIGKPCDVAARRPAPPRCGRALRDNLALTIAVFCAGTPTTRGTHEVVAGDGVRPPGGRRTRCATAATAGPATLSPPRAKDGAEHAAAFTYAQSWGDVLQRHRQWRCIVCLDHTGEFADVSVGDPWYREIPEDEPGRSLVVVRTERVAGRSRAAIAPGTWCSSASSPGCCPPRSPTWS